MEIKRLVYILIACYLATFLRFYIDNNLITSILGSFLVGFFINKRLSYSSEKILFTGFFSCLTSFSGFIYFLYEIFNQGGLTQLIIISNFIILINLFTMYCGFWISRKIT